MSDINTRQCARMTMTSHSHSQGYLMVPSPNEMKKTVLEFFSVLKDKKLIKGTSEVPDYAMTGILACILQKNENNVLKAVDAVVTSKLIKKVRQDD